VKLVRRINSAGAKERTVITRTIFKATSMEAGVWTPSRVSVSVGRAVALLSTAAGDWAEADE
jgi:hypothetical protein